MAIEYQVDTDGAGIIVGEKDLLINTLTTITVPISYSQAGKYRPIFTIDYNNVYSEVYENNNKLVSSIKIYEPVDEEDLPLPHNSYGELEG